MEYIDIFDYNNNPTGEIKEKTQAHEDGNFHRTAYVWIMNDKKELLLQKRSATKKSHPNFWDISGVGHIRAGETVIEGAIRELKEELGVEVKEEGLLIHEEEYKYLFKYIRKQNIEIRKCTINDVDEIYNIQNIIIENFEQEEKGYFLPFKKETYLRILNDPINDGEIYGTFIDNKMIAQIFLSVSNRMKELKQMIPNLNGSCADIDGVVVLPKYRGYGLQKTLVKYLEERAREKGISNIIAEVTFGNVYSLRNLKDLGYEEQTWYQKDKNIKRYILLKKLGKTENG